MSLRVDGDVLRELRRQRCEEDAVPAWAGRLCAKLQDAKKDPHHAQAINAIARQGLQETREWICSEEPSRSVNRQFAQIHAAAVAPLQPSSESYLKDGLLGLWDTACDAAHVVIASVVKPVQFMRDAALIAAKDAPLGLQFMGGGILSDYGAVVASNPEAPRDAAARMEEREQAMVRTASGIFGLVRDTAILVHGLPDAGAADRIDLLAHGMAEGTRQADLQFEALSGPKKCRTIVRVVGDIATLALLPKVPQWVDTAVGALSRPVQAVPVSAVRATLPTESLSLGSARLVPYGSAHPTTGAQQYTLILNEPKGHGLLNIAVAPLGEGTTVKVFVESIVALEASSSYVVRAGKAALADLGTLFGRETVVAEFTKLPSLSFGRLIHPPHPLRTQANPSSAFQEIAAPYGYGNGILYDACRSATVDRLPEPLAYHLLRKDRDIFTHPTPSSVWVAELPASTRPLNGSAHPTGAYSFVAHPHRSRRTTIVVETPGQEGVVQGVYLKGGGDCGLEANGFVSLTEAGIDVKALTNQVLHLAEETPNVMMAFDTEMPGAMQVLSKLREAKFRVVIEDTTVSVDLRRGPRELDHVFAKANEYLLEVDAHLEEQLFGKLTPPPNRHCPFAAWLKTQRLIHKERINGDVNLLTIEDLKGSFRWIAKRATTENVLAEIKGLEIFTYCKDVRVAEVLGVEWGDGLSTLHLSYLHGKTLTHYIHAAPQSAQTLKEACEALYHTGRGFGSMASKNIEATSPQEVRALTDMLVDRYIFDQRHASKPFRRADEDIQYAIEGLEISPGFSAYAHSDPSPLNFLYDPTHGFAMVDVAEGGIAKEHPLHSFSQLVRRLKEEALNGHPAHIQTALLSALERGFKETLKVPLSEEEIHFFQLFDLYNASNRDIGLRYNFHF